MEKDGQLLKRSSGKSKEHMSLDKLTNNSVAFGTALSLPCVFVFLNLGKKFFS